MKMSKERKWFFLLVLPAVTVSLVIILPLVIRTHVFQAFKVASGSMNPTLQAGDHILVNKQADTIDAIRRKDIVVFEFPRDPSKVFVMRAVGMPGDNIEIQDKILFVNGERQNEDYAIHTNPTVIPRAEMPRDNFGPVTVPPRQLFIMGDNRDHSFDSRFWGLLDERRLKGRVTAIYWSWDRDNRRARWDRIGGLP